MRLHKNFIASNVDFIEFYNFAFDKTVLTTGNEVLLQSCPLTARR